MKKLLLITLFLAAISLVHAQINQTPTYQQYLQQKHGYQKQQTMDVSKLLPQKLQPLNSTVNKNEFNIDNMTVYGNIPPQFTFVENNNNGLDIYQSSPDNIYVVKPDAGFSSNMPTGNLKVTAAPPLNRK